MTANVFLGAGSATIPQYVFDAGGDKPVAGAATLATEFTLYGRANVKIVWGTGLLFVRRGTVEIERHGQVRLLSEGRWSVVECDSYITDLNGSTDEL